MPRRQHHHVEGSATGRRRPGALRAKPQPVARGRVAPAKGPVTEGWPAAVISDPAATADRRSGPPWRVRSRPRHHPRRVLRAPWRPVRAPGCSTSSATCNTRTWSWRQRPGWYPSDQRAGALAPMAPLCPPLLRLTIGPWSDHGSRSTRFSEGGPSLEIAAAPCHSSSRIGERTRSRLG